MNRTNTWIPISLVIAALGLSVALAIFRPQRLPSPPSPQIESVDVKTLEKTSAPLVVNGHGVLSPTRTMTLSALVDGQIIQRSRHLEDGARFSASETLLEIDPTDYELHIIRAQRALKDANAALAVAESNSRVSVEEWRAKRPGQEPPALVAQTPQLEAARAAVTGAEADLELAELNLSRAKTQAPFDGVCQQVLVNHGDYVRRGQPIAEIFATDTAEVRIQVSLRELHLLGLDVTSAASDPKLQAISANVVAVNAPRSSPRTARVQRVFASLADDRMARIAVELPDPYDTNSSRTPRNPIPPGAFVLVTLQSSPLSPVFVLPRAATLAAPQAGDTAGPSLSFPMVDEENVVRLVDAPALQVRQNVVVVDASNLPNRIRVALSANARHLIGEPVSPIEK